MLYHILHHINLRRSGILNDVFIILNDIIVARRIVAKRIVARRIAARRIAARRIVVKQNSGIHDVNVLLVTDADNKN